MSCTDRKNATPPRLRTAKTCSLRRCSGKCSPRKLKRPGHSQSCGKGFMDYEAEVET